MYTSPVFGRGPSIIGLSLIILFYFLPFLFLLITISDLYRKSYRTAINNIIIVLVLFVVVYTLKVFVLDKHVYNKYEDDSIEEAAPPMEDLK